MEKVTISKMVVKTHDKNNIPLTIKGGPSKGKSYKIVDVYDATNSRWYTFFDYNDVSNVWKEGEIKEFEVTPEIFSGRETFKISLPRADGKVAYSKQLEDLEYRVAKLEEALIFKELELVKEK